MDGVQLPQCYKATARKQFTFYHLVSRFYRLSFDRTRKDEKLSEPWNHPMVGNPVPICMTEPLIFIKN